MYSEEEAIRRYSAPFQRHLSFFDSDNDGFVYFGESLRGNLSVGLDFPVAVVMALGVHSIYGNTGSVIWGPLRGIEISQVRVRRNMLEKIHLGDVPESGMGRKTLVAAAYPVGVLDKLHVNGLWALAADRAGRVAAQDVELYQRGTMLYELARRRRDNRDHVIPLSRGGPMIVSGHSYFVDKLFGVKVYQNINNNHKSS